LDLSHLKTRIESLLSKANTQSADLIADANELLQGTLTTMSAMYGSESYQVKALQDAAKEALNRKTGVLSHHMADLKRALKGTLENLKAEIESGLIGSLQKRIASDVLSDLVQLARVVLDEPGDNAKNVAAVLAAAAFEDTVRRMGSVFAGVMGKDDLSDVIEALKVKGFLVPPQLGIALSFLNFRNRALHANWSDIDRAAVNSVLGFVQELLLKHFS